MFDVSGTGLTLVVRASRTFPTGFPVTQFSDDTDPLDFPDMAIAEATMNINGDLVVSSTPTPINVTISLIPGSDDDNNMAVIYDANRAARGKRILGDEIMMVASYQDGTVITLLGGKLLTGNPGKSVASAGRVKSNSYSFAFQDIVRTRI